MCTAVGFTTRDHYFGRTLDLEYSYQEKVTITPRNFPLYLKSTAPIFNHHAFIGMATVANGFPLYYDGTNEHGLSIAALNFPGNAHYAMPVKGKTNIMHFEFIPWVLGSFKSVDAFMSQGEDLNIISGSFSPDFPQAGLHWIIDEKTRCVVVEATKDGLNIYENPHCVLTNNPTFPKQCQNLIKYEQLSSAERSAGTLEPEYRTRGTGGIGLPGDLTSQSRFVRALYTKKHSVCKNSESASVSQFFHILDSVHQTQGCVKAGSLYVKTVYSSCCNTDKGIYYYRTYENSQITGVKLFSYDLDSEEIRQYPLIRSQQFRMEN